MSETTNTSSAKRGFFHNVKSEFKKATWPKRDDLIKQSGLVVVVAVALGILISVIDVAIQYGVLKVLNIG